MAKGLSVLLATLAACGSVLGAIQEHLVTSLPGFRGPLPSKHYSGYIPVGKLSGGPGQLHYWMIESTGDPATDPVVLWLNGGPGSSSLIGLLTENGQIVTNDESLASPVDGVPQVFLNPHAWTSEATMIYLESPKGVGFSYCEGAQTNAQCVNTDESTAQDAYEFLATFFARFPEYRAQRFYVAGESYAGIYIPMLLAQIDADPLGAKVQVVGAAIGNGCWGNTVGTCDFYSPQAERIQADFFFGHGMYSQELRAKIDQTCGDFSGAALPPACEKNLAKMAEQMGTFDIYNVYDECGQDDRRRRRLRAAGPAGLRAAKKAMSAQTVEVSTADSFKVTAGYTQAINDYVCGAETAMDEWLAAPSVAEALHVLPGTVGMTYTKTATSLLPLYAELIQRHQILIYSGDTDGCVPYVGTEEWTRGLNFTVVKDWHQWMAKPDDTHAQHKAGYAVTYDKFQFITINGAGHMVPQYQPAYSLTMFRKFLGNERF